MKKAFTMLELVFVIVVIGILAAAIIPNVRTNPVQEAAVQLESHIRYTQHLAMVDDKFEAGANWYRNMWQIAFTGNAYSIVSNSSGVAQDPQSGNSINIDLNDDFGVSVSSCSNNISFDHLGRPITGNLSAVASVTAMYGNLLTSPCDINLTNNGETATIRIEPETGYTRRL